MEERIRELERRVEKLEREARNLYWGIVTYAVGMAIVLFIIIEAIS